MVDELKDPDAFAWWDRAWSLKILSWPMVDSIWWVLWIHHERKSTERECREDKEPCSPKSNMGEFLGQHYPSKGKGAQTASA